MREYYNLEEIWGGKKVRMKMAADKAAEHAKKLGLNRVEIVDDEE
jgi:ribosomal silencing factor RsfS